MDTLTGAPGALTQTHGRAAEQGPRRGAVRFRARAASAPLGAILGAIGLFIGLAVSLLHLDRLPVIVCGFKALTGLPCPTCGSTRALARLFSFDLAGALAMNPLVTLFVGIVGLWAMADLALLTRRRTLGVEVHPRLARALRVLVFVLFFANWVYLLLARR